MSPINTERDPYSCSEIKSLLDNMVRKGRCRLRRWGGLLVSEKVQSTLGKVYETRVNTCIRTQIRKTFRSLLELPVTFTWPLIPFFTKFVTEFSSRVWINWSIDTLMLTTWTGNIEYVVVVYIFETFCLEKPYFDFLFLLAPDVKLLRNFLGKNTYIILHRLHPVFNR